VKARETLKEAILSPVRLPFRHTGKVDFQSIAPIGGLPQAADLT
jgi:hypothetical protein